MAALHIGDAAERLSAFVARYGRRRHDWQAGVDCGLVLADWAVWLGFPDPVPHLRGAYRDAATCGDVLRTGGGLPSIVDRGLSAIGWVKVALPSTGAIAVLGSKQEFSRQWGAIRDGDRWLVQTGEGLRRVTAKPLSTWMP